MRFGSFQNLCFAPAIRYLFSFQLTETVITLGEVNTAHFSVGKWNYNFKDQNHQEIPTKG